MVCDIVTGATGFVGKAIALRWMSLHMDKQLLIVGRNRPNYLNKNSESEKKCCYIEFDFTKSPTSMFPVNTEVDTIYHCGGVASITAKGEDLFETNVKGTVNFLNWVGSATKIKQVIFISSALVCGYDISFNRRFCRLDGKTSLYPNTPYGRSKYETEIKIKALAKKFDFRLVIIRPAYIFGPGMRINSGFAKFIQMVQNQSIGVRLNCPGSLSYTFIDNFVSLVLRKAKNELAFVESFFADSSPILYTELFKAIAGLLKKEIKPLRLPEILYNVISRGLIYLYKIPYIKDKIPIYFLPLFKENVGCIDFDAINKNDKGCIAVSLEDGLKKTIANLKKS